MNEQKTEVMKTQELGIIGLSEDLKKSIENEIKENLESITELRLPIIRILHAGAKMFEIPEEGRSIKIDGTEGFEGVVIYAHRMNACWTGDFVGNSVGQPPACVSNDGITGNILGTNNLFSDEKSEHKCHSCEYNKYGSDGRGKKCKNMIEIFVLLNNDSFPSRLILPPSSIKVWDEYVTLLSQKQTPVNFIITKFKLKDEKNKDNITFSKLMLEKGSVLNENNIRKALSLKNTIKSKLKDIELTGEEIAQAYNAKTETSIPLTDSEEIPF